MVGTTDQQAPSARGTLPPELAPLQAHDPGELGALRIIGRLGSGGLGAVYGAVDPERRCLAVQTVSAEYAADPRFREVFAREVGLLGQVNGVCVPQVRDADTVGETLWVAADHVPGRALDRHLDEHGPLEGKSLLAFAAGCAEALASMHSAGIVHHDITPAKVILSPDGPRIVDVGTAPRAGEEHEDADPSGTPGWLAPERYRGAQVESPGDVFAWGALVVYAATGRPPFGEDDAATLRERVVHYEPDLDGVPEELREPVTSALTKDPASRPTAEDALRTLIIKATGETPEAAESRTAQRGLLRGFLALHWHGMDAADHDPEQWAVRAGLPLREPAVEQPTTHHPPRAHQPSPDHTAPMQAVPPDSPGAPTTADQRRRRGWAAIAVGAGIGLLAAALVGGAGYFLFDLVADSEEEGGETAPAQETEEATPETLAAREAIHYAAEEVLRADGFEAETVREHLDDPSVVNADHQYFTDPEPAYLYTVDDGQDVSGFVSIDDAVLEYSEDEEEWSRDPAPEAWQDFPGQDPFSRDGLVEPLRLMAEAEEIFILNEEEVDGVHTTVYGGTVEVLADDQGSDDETVPADFQVRIDENGMPVRHYYSRGDWEIRTTYLAIGGNVEPGFPWDELPSDPAEID